MSDSETKSKRKKNPKKKKKKKKEKKPEVEMKPEPKEDPKKKRAKAPRLAIAPVRGLMGDAGADLVSKNAVFRLVEHLESQIGDITKKALAFAMNAGRKKVMLKDVTLVLSE